MGEDGFNVQIVGLDELSKLLDEFPRRFAASAVRSAMRKGAEVIAAEAKALCPVAPPSFTAKLYYGAKLRDLQRSIRIGTYDIDKTTGRVVAFVKAGTKAKSDKAFYASWVEFGTASHYIKPKNRESLKFGGGFASKVEHPGAAKKPFMRPAMDGKQSQAYETVGRVLIEALEGRWEDMVSKAQASQGAKS